MRLLMTLMGVLMPLSALSVSNQDLTKLEQVAQHFVEHELRHRAATFVMGAVDRRVILPACEAPLAGWGNGAAASGATFVDVSCPALSWTVRVPVTITEKRMGVVTTRAIRAGEVLTALDVQLVDVANRNINHNMVTDVGQAVGQTLITTLPAGGWLRSFMLRPPLLVKLNQRVRVMAQGEGFLVATDGIAMGNASAGDSLSVRMPSGRVIKGEVRADGVVAVLF